jgi:hypothetical protein
MSEATEASQEYPFNTEALDESRQLSALSCVVQFLRSIGVSQFSRSLGLSYSVTLRVNDRGKILSCRWRSFKVL